MKTKKVIEILKHWDPTGELECVIDDKAIHSIEKTHGSNYGWYQMLERHPTEKHIIGGKISNAGVIVHINTVSIEDLIYEVVGDGDDFPVKIELDDPVLLKVVQELVKDWIAKAKDIREVLLK